MSKSEEQPIKRNSFADYRVDGGKWITLSSGQYFPDLIKDACALYEPTVRLFGTLVEASDSSADLLRKITSERNPARTGLLRIFRRYACPVISVEATKVVGHIESVIQDFGAQFRPIEEVRQAYHARPQPDEALCVLLWEYKDRGKQGYDLTEEFFILFQAMYPELGLQGPKRAGRDVALGDVFSASTLAQQGLPPYPNPNRPVDFVIYRDEEKSGILAIGLARYDSDRGGSQEDDRIGGYRDCADEIQRYAAQTGLNIKVIFLNDGPGLLLGSMWRDYAALEDRWPGKIMVLTFRMVAERLTD